MSDISWLTPRGNIGTFADAEYFEFQLSTVDATGSVVRYSLISGSLPYGAQLNQTTGLISGVPAVTRNDARSIYQFEFAVRAFNDLGSICDRRFEMSVGGILPIKITPREENLGSGYGGIVYKKQLTAVEFDATAGVSWSVVRGQLPPNLSLSQSGLLSGYLGTIADTASGVPGWDNTSWDAQTWDFFGSYTSKSFDFLVGATDGHSIDRINYTFTILARPAGRYDPIILTPAGELPSARQQTKFNFKFNAEDLNGDIIEYQLIPLSGDFANTGLVLDHDTGWLSGTVANQVSDTNKYEFQIYATKRDDPSFASRPSNYSLTIFGDLTNTVIWQTDENLGAIDNGEISIFQVRAMSPSGKPLYYSRLDGDPGALPPGLKLLPSGLISGQVSFQYFTMDQVLETPTQIDGGATTFDTMYRVNIVARDYGGNLESTRTFVIKVTIINKVPYQNLYLTALPSLEQREKFRNIINNTALFPTELIYRFDDPYYGKANKIRSMFAAGLVPSDLEKYAIAAQKNHFDKRLFFGEIKTAQAVDENFVPLYEVVYVELVDQVVTEGNGKFVSPALETNLSGSIANPYYTEQGQQLKTLQPNSFNNMTQRISDQIGYINRGAWPTQELGRRHAGPDSGLINSVILAYTVPGGAGPIAFGLRAHGVDFGPIDFVADRYELDIRSTLNFNLEAQRFDTEPETIFDLGLDVLERVNIGTVEYAVTMPFNEINDKSVLYVQNQGSIDGSIDFQDGDTLIFIKQQNYAAYSGSNDGWERTVILAGAPTTEVIPGYTQNILDPSTPNQRAGIWRIGVRDELVTLTFINEVRSNELLMVKKGIAMQGTRVYYSSIITEGNTVPEYSIVSGNDVVKTTFDNSGTRFFSHSDNYTRPSDNAKYIKFPQFGAIK